jgi:hypothetical protein
MINKTRISSAVQGCIINTGDYIDPEPWTKEDHKRFMEAVKRVHKLRDPDEETVLNHPHTEILSGMGVKTVNGFSVNK